MGIMETRLRNAFLKYRKDKDLFYLLTEMVDIADSHVHYAWQRTYLDNKLTELFVEILANNNPTHRFGDVNREGIMEEKKKYTFQIEKHIISGRWALYIIDGKQKSMVGLFDCYMKAEALKRILINLSNSELSKIYW